MRRRDVDVRGVLMFREMRRKNQMLSQDEIRDVLHRGTSGVLALSGDDGYPYAVPISYVCDGDKLYFHCAKSGHKIDAIRRNGRASFCVIDQDQIVPEEYTTYYRSVIVFGRIRIIEDEKEKRAAVEKLALKYSPKESASRLQSTVDRAWASLCMLEMSVDHATGKEAIELIKRA